MKTQRWVMIGASALLLFPFIPVSVTATPLPEPTLCTLFKGRPGPCLVMVAVEEDVEAAQKEIGAVFNTLTLCQPEGQPLVEEFFSLQEVEGSRASLGYPLFRRVPEKVLTQHGYCKANKTVW